MEIHDLTQTQRTVHDTFWALLTDGKGCGRGAIVTATGLPPATVQSAMTKLIHEGFCPPNSSRSKKKPEEWDERSFILKFPGGRAALGVGEFEVETLPDELPSAEELLERKRKSYDQKEAYEIATRLVNVKVKMDGPIGLLLFGDPHVDDEGCDIHQLERDIKVVSDTEAMFGCNVGDLHNNWVGRLGHLYSNQATTAQEAWVLVEWLIKAIPWIYIARGNHDVWSGAGDPIRWITKGAGVLSQPHGVRIALQFPNKKEVRNNCRHDFPGHSQWNPVHGPSKSFIMGWKDHILSCGHKHHAGHSWLEDPMTGLLAHAIRLAGYKKMDDHADKMGLPQSSAPGGNVVIIDPQYEDSDPRLLHWIPSTEEGAEFLTWKRGRK